MLHNLLEAMLRAGQHSLVLEEADQYFARADRDPVEAVLVAVWACRAAGGLRQWGLAVTWADRGLGLEPSDYWAEGVLRFSAARALMYIGDLFRAERELVRFRALAERVTSLYTVLGDALYNLAYINRLLNSPDTAITFFRQAASHFDAAGRCSQRTACRYEIAWTYLTDGRPKEALPELQACQAELSGCGDPELEVDLSIASALYHSLTGRPGDAERLCTELAGRADLLSRQLAEVNWILGSNALRGGDLKRAAGLLDSALTAAVEDWWPPRIERISTLRERMLAWGTPPR